MMLNGDPVTITKPRWDSKWEKLPPHLGQSIKPMPGRDVGSKNIHSLAVYDDEHVFIGHGDWQDNDGNTMLVSLNPKTREYTNHGVFTTEAIISFVKEKDKLYALFVDSVGGFWDSDYPYVIFGPNGVELPGGKVSSIHIFDLIEYSGDIYISGSAHRDGSGVGQVWVSEDRGNTWVETNPMEEVGDFNRSYSLFTKDSKLYVLSDEGNEYVIRLLNDDKSWSKTLLKYPEDYLDSKDPMGRIPYPDREDETSPRSLEESVVVKTSTHYVMGDSDGNIYIREVD